MARASAAKRLGVEDVIVALTARRTRWHAGLRSPFSHSEAVMLVGSSVRRVAIVGGLRIPFARSMGAYAEASNQEMLTATLAALVERYRLKGATLGDVGAGVAFFFALRFLIPRLLRRL